MGSIFIPTCRGTKTVEAKNIIRIEASSNYCKIFFDNDRPLVVAKVLHWFQDCLPADNFYRIHRTHIINKHHIADIAERGTLKLTNGDLVQISRRRRSCASLLLQQSA